VNIKYTYLASLFLWFWVTQCLAGEVSKESTYEGNTITSSEAESLLDELEQGFYYRFHVLAFGIAQGPKQSNLNPNNVLGVQTYQAVVNPRLDMNLDYGRLELSVKERFWNVWERWEDGIYAGRENNTAQFYLNEWFARVRVLDDLFVSYGRENLQWGPSVLLSSSNPFNPQNGRNNPRIEVPGLGYARTVWVPNSNWSASFIANTDSGRLYNAQYFGLDQTSFVSPAQRAFSSNFSNAYAFKIDYTGDGKYFSFVPSYRDNNGYQFGYFGGINASDSILLYSEGALGEHTDFQIQGGASYTFEEGQSLNVEYYHNNKGCLDASIRECFFRGQITSGDVYWRQDYIMSQYSESKVWRDLNINLRYIHNLNDQSNQMVGIFEYEVDENILLYIISSGYTGTGKSEFGSLLKYSAMVGAGYTF
jgi:hypothetical protein